MQGKNQKNLWKKFFLDLYNVLFDEANFFDIKTSKIWALFTDMALLRNYQVFFFDVNYVWNHANEKKYFIIS